jgi:hypothetical protein
MRHLASLACCLLPLALLGCQRTPPSAHPAAQGDYTRSEWLVPSAPGAIAPGLAATHDGRLLLSWISTVPGRRDALQFAAWGDQGHWESGARTIVVGDALLAEAANRPHMAATADGALWVQWLQKDLAQPRATDLMLARSVDGGFNWSPPARINTRTDDAERGFVSLWPAGRDSLGAAWLDGSTDTASSTSSPTATTHADHARTPKPGVHAMDHGASDATSTDAGSSKSTALHAALFDRLLQRHGDAVVDTVACDCCQTAAAAVGPGALLVFRDRDAKETRDIAVARFDGTRWTPATPVHADHWTMPACPVNGPSLAVRDNTAFVAWYTAANQQPTVSLARSRDGGQTFDSPVVVDHGDTVQGRVAVAFDGQQAWIAWLRTEAGGQALWLARYTPDLARELQRMKIATLHGQGIASGYPQLALHRDAAYLVWTDVAAGTPHLRGAIVSR